jgi:hypothetical protein
MTTEQLAQAIRAQPFRPFILHIAGDRALKVRHPEHIAYRGGRTAVVFKDNETSEVVDLLRVASIEFEPAPPGTPGRRRRS